MKEHQFKHPDKNTLDKIREKVTSSNLKLTKDEILAIEEVYHDITGRKIKKDCAGCMLMPFKIIQNYINYHEPKGGKETKVKKVTGDYEDYSLAELRDQFPDIKATSKKVFIEKINENGGK